MSSIFINKNSIEQFVSFLEKEKCMSLKLFQLINHAENVHQNHFETTFLTLINPKQPLHARNSFKKLRCFHYQMALKKLTLIFPSYPVPFNGLSSSYKIQKL